jgi:hypothetical protein
MKQRTIEKHHWKLWCCDQSSGRDSLCEWGEKEEMLHRMGARSLQDHDVWLIDPHGNKHHPDGRIEGHNSARPLASRPSCRNPLLSEDFKATITE